MTKTEQYILTRLDALEKAFIQAQINGVKVTENADKAPIVEIKVNDLGDEVAGNAEDIASTMEAVAETYEAVDGTNADVETCMEAIAEIYEMIGE